MVAEPAVEGDAREAVERLDVPGVGIEEQVRVRRQEVEQI